jgi:thiol-disulfide isomerase/thioredoxin
MSEVREAKVKGGSGRSLLSYALWGAALIGAAAVLYVIVGALIKPAGGPSLNSLAHGEMAKLQVAGKPTAAPDTPFIDAEGRSLRISDLKGPVRVVNLWATWCAPCVKEMPTLAKLQAAYPGRIVVAPISMDRLEDREKARAFIAEHPPLGFFQDPKYALAFALDPPAEGFPTTVIYDARGHERARLSGGADWGGADARAVVEFLLSGQ